MNYSLLGLSYTYLSRDEYNSFVLKYTRLNSKLKRRCICIKDIHILIEYLFDLVTAGKRKFNNCIFQEIRILSLLSLRHDLSHTSLSAAVGYISRIPCIPTLKKIFIKYHEMVSFPTTCVIESLYAAKEYESARHFMLRILRKYAGILDVWIKFFDFEFRRSSSDNIFLQAIIDNSRTFLSVEDQKALVEHSLVSVNIMKYELGTKDA